MQVPKGSIIIAQGKNTKRIKYLFIARTGRGYHAIDLEDASTYHRFDGVPNEQLMEDIFEVHTLIKIIPPKQVTNLIKQGEIPCTFI